MTTNNYDFISSLTSSTQSDWLLAESLGETAVQGLEPPLLSSIMEVRVHCPPVKTPHTSPLITGGDGAAAELAESKLTPDNVRTAGILLHYLPLELGLAWQLILRSLIVKLHLVSPINSSHSDYNACFVISQWLTVVNILP